MVTFLWPEFLWLAAVPVLVTAVAMRGLGLSDRQRLRVAWLAARTHEAARMGWLVRLPSAFVGLAVVFMLLAAARPSTTLGFVEPEQTLILAIDVSSSMRAHDVQPTRIVAAQLTAKGFIERLPGHVRVGVVAYAEDAQLVQPPTSNRQDACAAIERFVLQPGTAIGGGILRSLEAIHPRQDIAALLARTVQARPSVPGLGPAARASSAWSPAAAASAPALGDSSSVVLLTDGQNTSGPDPLDAAQVAALLGVKVYTLGFGAPEGAVLHVDGFGMLVRLDEAVLVEIAARTGGQYFRAGTVDELRNVYDRLQSRLVARRDPTEISAVLAAIAAVMLSVGVELSCAWFGRVF